MKKIVFCLLLTAFSLTSCIYYPHLTGNPLIREKGDTRIEGGINFTIPNIYASVARGLTENIAVQLAGSANGEIYYTHAAVGYYKNMKDRNVIELYGGFAYGYGDADNNANPGNLRGNYQMYFTQFNYGNIKKKFANLETGVGLKLGYMHSRMEDCNYFYNNIYDDYIRNPPYPIYSLNGVFVQPTLFMRFGGSRLKFNASLGSGLFFQLNNTDKELPLWPFNLGIGVSYSFGGKKSR